MFDQTLVGEGCQEKLDNPDLEKLLDANDIEASQLEIIYSRLSCN